MNFLRNTFIDAYQKKPYPNYWDAIAIFVVLSVIVLLAANAKQMAAPYHLGQPAMISLATRYLPGYALRTILRMFCALAFSLLFTFIFATWAAKSRRAERIIIPLIDILQSVPILGFLSITVVAFIELFPGSMLGPECAAIFAIFTSQAWNMALGFYQTVQSVPAELTEAANMFHLSAWQKFWKIEVPFSLPGLLWNTMMSMSAGWFFVVASEAISVNNQQIMLPGIGSYITLAIETANLPAIIYAIITMLLVIIIYDQLLFRPLVAWSEKFKTDQVGEEQAVYSWVIDLLRRTRLLRYIAEQMAYFFNAVVNMPLLRSRTNSKVKPVNMRQTGQLWRILSRIILALLFSSVASALGYFLWQNIPLSEVWHVFLLGLITALRVFILIILCSVIWVPIGGWLGLRPRAAQIIQPLAQFFAAFPANLFYPLVVVVIVKYYLNSEIWLTPLMILGAQWYILFNVVAGASVIPKDLLQVTDNFHLPTVLRWRRLILPAIFPYYVTGAITAVGGAWNASIVAEVVNWGDKKLMATGLGAYISEYTAKGDFLHIALGIGMMCFFVLVLNHILWRPLYRIAVTRYQLS